jgi:imidazolonepropionase-like amidohydrolase
LTPTGVVSNDRQRRRLWAALVAVLAFSACEGAGAGKTAYVGATLWDGTGAPVINDAVIIVNGARIEAIGPPDLVKVPRGADVRRMDGKWIIPGLIDSHVHLERWMLRPFLAYGVTAVRDLGGPQDTVIALRDALNLGTILGPRYFMAGAVIDGIPPSSPYGQGVRTAHEGRRAVDERVLMEASHAVVGTKINRQIFSELMHEAKVLRLPVAAYLGRVDAETAAREGVHTIERLTGIVEATVSNPGDYFRAYSDFYTGWKTTLRGWNTLDSARIDRTARALAETEVSMVPTLVSHRAFAHLRDRSYIESLDLTAVPKQVTDSWPITQVVREAGLRNSDFNAFRLALKKQELFVRRFRAAGGIVVAGSDTPHPLLAPGSSLHDEMSALVAAGFSTKDALLAATRDAGRVLMADSLGVLTDGGLADFVVVEGDPLADIENARKIYLVVFRGVEYTREGLLAPPGT